MSYNCVDRHAAKNPDRVAIIYEGDEPTDIVKITFGELLERVRHLTTNKSKLINNIKRGVNFF